MSKSSQMITFTFQNGCVATLRTSGTEPKIKYYAEMCALPGHRSVPRALLAAHSRERHGMRFSASATLGFFN